MSPARRSALGLGLGLVISYLSVVLLRPVLPIDETRYLSVAWEMWVRHDWILPTINFEPYHHKPPLLFWLINFFWGTLGVSRGAATLAPYAAAAAGLYLTAQLAQRLYPKQPAIATHAPWILAGLLLWQVLQTMLMFDVLLTACVLLNAFFVIRHVQRPAPRTLWLLAGSAGLGIIAKGPVLLLHDLALLLAASLYLVPRGRRGRAFLILLATTLAGASLALLWAIPAALRGGDAYAHMLFWGQTADRMKNSFAHAQPFWFYLALLPVYALPWCLTAPFWRGVTRPRSIFNDASTRFLGAWCGFELLLFSSISAKQPHYLLPVVPALAILIARQMTRTKIKHLSSWGPYLLYTLPMLGALVISLAGELHLYPLSSRPLQWANEVAPGLIVLSLAAFFLLQRHAADITQQIRKITAFSVLFLVFVHGIASQKAFDYYDLGLVGNVIEDAMVSHQPVAYAGSYNGEFSYLARLHRPLPTITLDRVEEWLRYNPDGYVVSRQVNGEDPRQKIKAVHEFPYKTRHHYRVFEKTAP